MALARDLSELPTSTNAGGLTPDPEPRFIQALAEAWAADKDDDKATALGTRVRHSDAGACARKIAYVAAGIPKSDPMDLTGVWNTTLGTLLHNEWQARIESHVTAWAAATYPNHEVTVEIEPKVGHPDLDDSGHVDAVITVHVSRLPFPVASRLGDATKAAGRRGIARARAVLAANRPPDLASERRHREAREALARTTTRVTTTEN